MIKKINLRSEFLKYTMVLMSGTVVAQLLSVLLSPVITRLYTPEEASELGLYMRIAAFGSALATARYELSMPIMKADGHAFRIFRFALRIMFFALLASSLLILIPIFYEDARWDRLIFYGLIAVSIGLLAFFNLGTNWSLRMKKFKTITYAKMGNSIGANVSKILFGYMGVGYLGLIFGTVIGHIIGNLWFVKSFTQNLKKFKVKAVDTRTKLLAKEHIDFPTINLPHVLVDLGRDLLFALILLNAFGEEEFGLYDHSYRILRLPLVFAGVAVGQVFFQRGAEMINKGQSVLPMMKRSVGLLAILSIIPFGLIFLYGEEMFGWVFGKEWSRAGAMSEILSFWLAINFMVSPLSSIPLVLRRQKEFFLLGSIGAVLMLIAVAIPAYVMKESIEFTLWVVSITQAIYMTFLIFVTFYFAKLGRKS